MNRNSEMGGRCSHGETNREGKKSLSRQEDDVEREEAGDKNLMIVISQEDDNVERVERVDNGLTNPRTLTMHFSNHVEKDMEVYNMSSMFLMGLTSTMVPTIWITWVLNKE